MKDLLVDSRAVPSAQTTDSLQRSLDRLREIVGRLGPMLVAYSGGADSAFLLKVAHDVLGSGAIAVTAVSPSLSASERKKAAQMARAIGACHVEIDSGEMDDPRYASNPVNRCYFCKSELFDRLREVGSRLGVATIVYGANVDDLGDFRPGMKAAAETGVHAPLIEAGLGKGEIRALSLRLGLPTWDKPASPCLSSRIPHGVEITPERLGQIDRAEQVLAQAGFREFRVRYHIDVARLEIAPGELSRILDEEVRRRVLEGVRRAGFRYVAVDLEGYSRGSLNIQHDSDPPGSLQ